MERAMARCLSRPLPWSARSFDGRRLPSLPLTFRARRVYSAIPCAGFADLRRWVEDQGGYVSSGLRLEQDGGSGLGLLATRKLSPGEKLIVLPSHVPLALPVRSASHSLSPADESLLSLVERVPEELWALRLGLKLLSEKAREKSFWWPYIRLLPQRYSVPIFFSGDELESLQYPALIYQAKQRCRFLGLLASEGVPSSTEGLSLDQQPFGGQRVDAGALGWAMASVSSRAFKLHTSAATIDRVLLPLVDMCNHSFSPNAKLEQAGLPGNRFQLEVVVESQLEEGMPVALNYGPHSNDFLLLDYGFVIPGNPYERISLRFDGSLLDSARLMVGLNNQGLASFSSPEPWQQALLAQLRLQDGGVTLGGPEIVDDRLLAAMRILYANDASQLRHVSLQQLQQWSSRPPLGSTNESLVVRTLSALCDLVLKRHFPTSVEEDRELLATANLSSNQQVAIEYRLSKKQVLLSVIDGLRGKFRDLQMDARNQERQVEAKRGKGFG